MSKWIAEFELEDGDKMPEHMDLEYRGVKLDFHCRPIEKTYEDGLNEAWELVRKLIYGESEYERAYSIKDINAIFGRRGYLKILKDYTASEAIKQVKEYEEKQKEIKVGDEVIDSNGMLEKRSVVVRVSGSVITIMEGDGTVSRWEKEGFKKTGRHFSQIEEVLKQMQEEHE